jgi:fluoride exporter
MFPLAVVAVGGAIGAVARYQAAVWMQTRWPGPFPAGTVAVNLVGCFLIGLLAGMLESRPTLSPMVRLFVAAGLLGSFTTFSTFGLETIAAISRGHVVVAFANVAVSVMVGLSAVAAGIWLGRLV